MIDENIEKTARFFETPFYLLNMNVVNKNMDDLSEAFRKRYDKTSIAYSYKTNYDPCICKAAFRKGFYAEVVSLYELEKALEYGVNGERIIFNGVGKTEKSIYKALSVGATINVDSINELKLVASIENKLKSHSRIGLRINLDCVGSGVSRFGIDPDEIDEALSIAGVYGIMIQGLHCHISKARMYEDWYLRAFHMRKLAYRLPDIGYIDLGGGMFGNMVEDLKRQYKDNNSYIPTFDMYAEAVDMAFDIFKANDFELIIEPGTALVADSMSLVSTVLNVKERNGTNIVFLDCTSFDTGFIGQYKDIPAENVSNHSKEGKEYVLTGATCIEDDVIKGKYFGSVRPGDVFCFKNVGAYSNNLSPEFITKKPIVIPYEDKE